MWIKQSYQVRVSVSCPLIGSRTASVRSKTPFCKPMLTNMVGSTWLHLVDTGVQHIGDTDGRRRSSQHLKTDSFDCALRGSYHFNDNGKAVACSNCV